MTTNELEKVHKAQPFVPFRLHLTGGRALTVAHPEWMAYAPRGRTTTVYLPDGDFEIVDLLLVESIEVLRGGKRRRSATNGRRNGR